MYLGAPANPSTGRLSLHSPGITLTAVNRWPSPNPAATSPRATLPDGRFRFNQSPISAWDQRSVPSQCASQAMLTTAHAAIQGEALRRNGLLPSESAVLASQAKTPAAATDGIP